jgi:hypothetical protein
MGELPISEARDRLGDIVSRPSTLGNALFSPGMVGRLPQWYR